MFDGSEKTVMAACTQVIQKDPKAGWAYRNRAQVYIMIIASSSMKSGDVDSAIADLSKVLEFDAGDREVYSNRARLYAMKGGFDAAIRDLTRIVYMSPDNSYVCWSLGYTYDQRKSGRTIWDDDPKTAEICKIEKPRPQTPEIVLAPLPAPTPLPELPALPPPARKIDWPSHIGHWGGLLTQWLLLGSIVGFIVGLLRTGVARKAMEPAFVYGLAFLAAFAILNCEFIMGQKLKSFWIFRKRFLLDPLLDTFIRLGGPKNYVHVIGAFTVVGSGATFVVAMALLSAIKGTNYLDFAQGDSVSIYTPGNPHRSLPVAFPVLGTGIAVAAYQYGPRRYMSSLEPGTGAYAAMAVGVLLAIGVPLLVWRRSASWLQLGLGALLLTGTGFVCLDLHEFSDPPFLSFAFFLAALSPCICI